MTDNGLNQSNAHLLKLVPYDRDCLDSSWLWLKDPEIKKLTMTGEFSREDQVKFFNTLSKRSDYLIWGVLLVGVGVVGAAGLKNHRYNMAEYWGYIGDKRFWGKGLGRQMINAVEIKAKELGFYDLDLKVTTENKRAIALYEKLGFKIDKINSTEDYLVMIKKSI